MADCSVIAAIIFAEPDSPIALRQLEGAVLHAPWLIDIEIASVALKKSGSDNADDLRSALAHFSSLAIERHEVEPAQVYALAVQSQLTAYDAAYLLVASQLRVPLVTFDRRLGTAAQRHLGALE